MEHFSPDLFLDRDYPLLQFTHASVTQSYWASKAATTDFDLTGLIVWQAAEDLAGYLIDHQELVKGAAVLELGAGVGLTGLVASQFARKVYLTDGEDEVVRLLQRNASLAACECTAQLFKWGPIFRQQVDLIIGADVVFWPQSLIPLVETLGQMVGSGTKCILALKERSMQIQQQLDELLSKRGLHRRLLQRRRVPIFQVQCAP